MNIIQVYERFPSEAACVQHLEEIRWGGEVLCAYCNAPSPSPIKNQRYHCNQCQKSFSVTVGTIFHHTHLPVQKWFLAITLVLNAKKGLSARQLARDLGINKDTAWRITMKIREAMKYDGELLSGIVEMDETYIGGKPRKKSPRVRYIRGVFQPEANPNPRGRGTPKIPVIGAVARSGNVIAKNVEKANGATLNEFIRGNVDPTATLMTDEYRGYQGVKKFMEHLQINHKKAYVDGIIHTNTIESFWAIVKRGIVGQYHKVSGHYLHCYLDEFTYRYNNRETDAQEFFDKTLMRAVSI